MHWLKSHVALKHCIIIVLCKILLYYSLLVFIIIIEQKRVPCYLCFIVVRKCNDIVLFWLEWCAGRGLDVVVVLLGESVARPATPPVSAVSSALSFAISVRSIQCFNICHQCPEFTLKHMIPWYWVQLCMAPIRWRGGHHFARHYNTIVCKGPSKCNV